MTSLLSTDFGLGASKWMYLGNGSQSTIDVPVQRGALYSDPSGDGQGVFVVRFHSGTAPADMGIAIRIAYGDIGEVVVLEKELFLKEGEGSRDYWIQVNCPLDSKTPLNYDCRVLEGPPGKHFHFPIETRFAKRLDMKFQPRTPLLLCEKGDPDFAVIVDKTSGTLCRAPWYNQPWFD